MGIFLLYTLVVNSPPTQRGTDSSLSSIDLRNLQVSSFKAPPMQHHSRDSGSFANEALIFIVVVYDGGLMHRMCAYEHRCGGESVLHLFLS